MPEQDQPKKKTKQWRPEKDCPRCNVSLSYHKMGSVAEYHCEVCTRRWAAPVKVISE
jgi:transcription elongation factor Elf1